MQTATEILQGDQFSQVEILGGGDYRFFFSGAQYAIWKFKRSVTLQKNPPANRLNGTPQDGDLEFPSAEDALIFLLA